jgi:hypothetical protein
VINRVQWQAGRVAASQQSVLQSFQQLVPNRTSYCVPLQRQNPWGKSPGPNCEWMKPLDQLQEGHPAEASIQWPEPVPPGFEDFIAAGRRLVIVGARGAWAKLRLLRPLAGPWPRGTPRRIFESCPSIRPIPWEMPLANLWGMTLLPCYPICRGRKSMQTWCWMSFAAITCGNWPT